MAARPVPSPRPKLTVAVRPVPAADVLKLAVGVTVRVSPLTRPASVPVLVTGALVLPS